MNIDYTEIRFENRSLLYPSSFLEPERLPRIFGVFFEYSTQHLLTDAPGEQFMRKGIVTKVMGSFGGSYSVSGELGEQLFNLVSTDDNYLNIYPFNRLPVRPYQRKTLIRYHISRNVMSYLQKYGENAVFLSGTLSSGERKRDYHAMYHGISPGDHIEDSVYEGSEYDVFYGREEYQGE